MSTPEQPRDRHIRRGDGAGFRPTTPPTDSRPYRRASEPSGSEMRTYTINAQQTWRQVGWHGQTGAFYALGEKPADHEPGSYAPLWILVDNEPTDTPLTPATTGPQLLRETADELNALGNDYELGPGWGDAADRLRTKANRLENNSEGDDAR